jgi:hypothetical protein
MNNLDTAGGNRNCNPTSWKNFTVGAVKPEKKLIVKYTKEEKLTL